MSTSPPADKQKMKRASMTEVRKERRRTTDREAQRASRARTKKRIEELESMVESLLANQGDDRVNLLSRQLEEQREKNRTMVASLTAIQKVLSNAPPDTTCPNNVPQDSNPSKDERQMRAGSADSDSDRSEDRDRDRDRDRERQRDRALSNAKEDGRTGRGGYWKDVKELLSGQTLNQKVTKATILPLAGLHHSSPTSWQDLESGWMATRNTRLPPAWEVVNTALINAIFLMSQERSIDTSLDSDIAVRAVLQGWAEVEAACVLDVGWKLLQEIDQYVFFQCSPVTRMAILRIMRLELLHKINAVRDSDSVPHYIQPRPATNMVDHPVLVDFFVWPDLRDHMMLSPSIYIANNFGRLFSKSLRFLWPESMTDAWSVSPKTGNYEFSGLFNNRFQEVHCWSLSMDFFMEYPQVIGLVPMYNPLPRSLGGAAAAVAAGVTSASGASSVAAAAAALHAHQQQQQHQQHNNNNSNNSNHHHHHHHHHGSSSHLLTHHGTPGAGSNTSSGGYIEEYVADEWDANAAEAAQAASFMDDAVFA